MNRYALIKSGAVDTVVEAPATPTAGMGGEWVLCGNAVGPGDLYDGNAFSKPASVTEPRHITQLAFLSRFTDAEAIAIDLASIGGTQQAAAMRRYTDKVKVALFIDLDRADTRAGVQALETATLLGAGRALEILDAAIEPHEKRIT